MGHSNVFSNKNLRSLNSQNRFYLIPILFGRLGIFKKILEDTSKTINCMKFACWVDRVSSLSYLSLTWRCCLIYNFITFSFWNCCMTHCHHCQELTYYRCSWLRKKKTSECDLSNKQPKCNNRYRQIIAHKNLMKYSSSFLYLYTNFSMQDNFFLLYLHTG